MKKSLLYCCIVLLATVCVSNQARADKKELVYRLKWLFNASVAGDIYADAHGYFDRAGLKVVVKQGGPEKNAIKELELGQASFGVASADQVIRALDKGAEVVVLAQIFQTNPMQWIYRAKLPELTDITQLKGKSIGVTFGGNDESIMNTLLAKGGLTTEDVNIHSARFDFTPFLTGKVEIWPVYRNSQGVILKSRLQAEGENVRFLNPADFGVSFVANSIITSKKMIEKHPETVDRFLNSLLAAWTDSMNPTNEDKTLAAIASRDKGNTENIIKLQLLATRHLVQAETFGTIDVASWKQTEEIMLKEKQIRNGVEIEKWLRY
ncbi:MAG: ABC transporter substrate-binding protein [Desulforhopalus sp.]